MMKMARTTYASISKIVELDQCEYTTAMMDSNDMTTGVAESARIEHQTGC